MDLGKRFKHYRNKANLSQTEAALKIGVKNYQLANYESNRSEPNISILKNMSAVYGVTIDLLVGNTKKNQNFDNSSLVDEPIDVEDLARKLDEIARKIEKIDKE